MDKWKTPAYRIGSSPDEPSFASSSGKRFQLKIVITETSSNKGLVIIGKVLTSLEGSGYVIIHDGEIGEFWVTDYKPLDVQPLDADNDAKKLILKADDLDNDAP